MSDVITISLNGRTVGEVGPDAVFQKKIKGSKHLLYSPPAVAFADETIRQAKAAGAVSLRIIDTESKRTFTASLETFDEKCFPVNRGYESQKAMRLSEFDITGGRTIGDAAKAFKSYDKRQARKKGDRQLSLWK